MIININEGTKPLPKKYELSEKPTKKEVIDKVLSFLNDNKSIKIYDELSYGSYLVKINNLPYKVLHDDFMTFDSSLYENYFAVEKDDGNRTIFKGKNDNMAEINKNFSLEELILIYEAYVKNVGDYNNIFIKLRNLQKACKEYGSVFFVDVHKDTVLIYRIKNFSFNTIKKTIRFEKLSFELSKDDGYNVASNLEDAHDASITDELDDIKTLMTLKAVSEDEVIKMTDELLNDIVKMFNDRFGILKSQIKS